MTVTGATTAQVATNTYSPPFKYVSTYPAPVQITGTVTGPVNNNPTVPAGSSDSDYAWAYLQAHMMSPPSYRYAYLLWMCLAFIALVYAIGHHLRLSRTSLGAVFAKFGVRRLVLGSKKPGKRNRALPSNGAMLTVILITAVTLILCLVGSDYIAPSSSVLDFSTSFKRAVQSSTSPNYTIGKSLWTLGSRFGYMAFALLPAVVLLALKAPPFALLSIRPLTHLHADKLATFHRAIGWLIFAITTAHVALWTVQLFQDSRGGRATWFALWTNYRFIAGCVGYAAMCALMVMSVRPIRKQYYEVFYLSHVIFVALTLAGCVVHHPVLWYWIAAAAGLWLLERGFRYARFARINAFSKVTRREHSGLQAGPDYAHLPGQETYGLRDIRSTNFDKTLPRVPQPHVIQEDDFYNAGSRNTSGYYDEGSLQPLGAYEARFDDSASHDDLRHAYSESRTHFPPPVSPARFRNSTGTVVSAPNITGIPAGSALAQLLPSRTIRLTINTPRPFKWAAGQSCLLYLPEFSKIQSHPFTIVNNDNTEVVLLVKARKGITRRLYNTVRKRSFAHIGVYPEKGKRLSLPSARGSGIEGMQLPPVHIQAWLDGPFGSASRVRWHQYATVVIICGGSGVSFGAAICDHVCRVLAQKSKIRRGNIALERVRFCWIVREYAEIAWVAGQLYRCRQLVSSSELEISIFVTNGAVPRDDFALPRPGFAHGHRRSGSRDSMDSAMSRDSSMDVDDPYDDQFDPSTQYADVVDLTNYEDEEDINDPAELQLSKQVQFQGKLRRARSRRAEKGPTGQTHHPVMGHEPRRSRQTSRSYMVDSDPYAGSDAWEPSITPSASQYDIGVPLDESSARHYVLSDSRPQSYRSLADPAYGIYDPYAGSSRPGFNPSPSPSIMNFDDTASIAGESVKDLLARTSRSGSMMFLEEVRADAENDAGVWIDQADFAAMNVMSEMARQGKPKISSLIEEEIHHATGTIMIATCGPVTLNTVVRNLAAKHGSLSKARSSEGGTRIAVYSEDYET